MFATIAAFTAACATDMATSDVADCEGDACDQAQVGALDANAVVGLLFDPAPTLDPAEAEAVLELVNQKTCGPDEQCLRQQCGEDLQCFAAAGHIFAATQGPRLKSGGLIRSVTGKGVTYRSVGDLWSVITIAAHGDAAFELETLVEYAMSHGFAD